MAKSLQIDLQLRVDQAQQALKQLSQQAQQAFKQSGGSSQSYQQVAQAAAAQKVYYKDMLSYQSAFNKSLQEEASHRQKAMQVAQQHRQAMLQQYTPAARTLAGAVPGGNILGAGLGLGGTAALGGAVAAAAAIAAVGAEINKLGDRARELSQSAGSASSQLGQLRSAVERSSIRTDIAATSPGVVSLEKFKADWGSNLADFNAHSFSSKDERDKALNEKLKAGLGGQNGEEWNRLKQSRLDQEQDIGIARTALDRQTFTQQRDYALQIRNFQIDTGRQIYDQQKQGQRQAEDYSIQKARFDQNQAGVMAQKQFDLSQKYALQSYQISQGYATQDYSRGRAAKAFDYNLSQSRNQTGFGISQSRNQTEFNINKSRQGEDYSESLQKAVLGGANGMDLMWMSRDFRKEQTRQLADFQRSKSYAGQDFQLNKDYSQADFNISNARDARNFGISQGRNAQQFGISQQQAQAGRQLEIENMLYARKFEGVELELQHNRAVQDLSTSMERLNQDIARQGQALQIQGGDMQYNQNLAYSNFNLQTARQQRNMGNQFADFAGAARQADELGAAGQALKDPAFLAALNDNARRTGQADLFKQINDAKFASDHSLGAQIGDVINAARNGTAGDILPNAIQGYAKIKFYGDLAKQRAAMGTSGSFGPAGGGDWAGISPFMQPSGPQGQGQQAVNVNFYGGNTSFPAVPGVSPADLDRVNQQFQRDMQQLQQNVADELRKLYGG